MRTVITFLATIGLGWALGLWLPYWSLSLAAIIVGFLVQPSGTKALLAGLLGGAVLWGGLAYFADAANGQILSTRVAGIFGTSAVVMVAITALLGAILAGLGTWLGDRFRQGVEKD